MSEKAEAGVMYRWSQDQKANDAALTATQEGKQALRSTGGRKVAIRDASTISLV